MPFRKYIAGSMALIAFSIGAVSCGNDKSTSDEPKETTTKGNIKISIDDSYMPVMEQQLNVFDSSFPEAHITAAYKAEKQCFEDLYNDSARLIVVSREMTDAEKKVYEHNQVKIKSLAIAADAIAVIVNPASPDTFMTLGQLKQILQGKFARNYTIVFDNAQSGTVRYMLDSLIPGQQLSSKTYAVKNNDSLIAYVAKNENAIGFLSVSQVYDPESTVPEGSFKKGVKVVALKNENDTAATDFYQPYQAYIALKQYPLRRIMYFITRDTWSGLGAGFANFLSGEAGQLIFKKARLVPLRVPLMLREAEIK
jgi:phosphate transport system substrate-binding protein